MSIAATARGIKAAALYALIGGIWIIVTDRMLSAVLGQDGRAVAWQTWKGWAFVAASALFVFILARRAAQRERAALEREAELLVITDTLPGPVSRADREGRYLFANFAYLDWFGLMPSEVVGKTLREVLGEALYSRVEPHLERVRAGERVQYLEPAHSPDGKTRWGFFTMIPERAADGSVRGHYTIVQDVTEAEEQRRAHAESEVRYRRLVEKAPDGILVYKDGRIQLANTAAQRLVGARTESDVTGRPWDMFVDEADRERAMTRVEQLLHGDANGEPIALTLRRLDGTRLPVEISGVRFLDGDAPALHLIMRDLSARQSAEKALRELNRSLEARVARRTEELELAREQAESAEQLKSLFLARVSRRLGTPLESMNRHLGELLRGEAGEPSAAQRRPLQAVHQAARQMSAMIDDLQDISSLAVGELVLQEADYDLAAVLRDAAEWPAAWAREKGIAFEVRIGAGLEHATGDARRVHQVVRNLLVNAVCFTDAGCVTLSARQVSGQRVSIEVEDTGIGISPDWHERIFDPFFQVRPTDDPDPHATGLGLPISRRLARLMYGELSMASSPGAGSTFKFEVPLHANAASSAGVDVSP